MMVNGNRLWNKSCTNLFGSSGGRNGKWIFFFLPASSADRGENCILISFNIVEVGKASMSSSAHVLSGVRTLSVDWCSLSFDWTDRTASDGQWLEEVTGQQRSKIIIWDDLLSRFQIYEFQTDMCFLSFAYWCGFGGKDYMNIYIFKLSSFKNSFRIKLFKLLCHCHFKMWFFFF